MSTTPEAADPKPRHASEADAQADRELCGRFQAGNPGGPGNPYARQTAMFKKAIQSATTPDEAKALTRKIFAMAMDGDLAAAKLYFSYTAGKPAEAADPDCVDIHEMQILRETAPLKVESPAFIAAGSPESHLHMVRTMRPMIDALAHQQMMNAINQRPEDRARREDAEAAEAERILSSPAPLMPAELEAKIAAASMPLANGSNGADEREDAPLPNGSNGDRQPIANGSNGAKREEAPLPNGSNGQAKRDKKAKLTPDDRFQFNG